ncbi:hypothetical protein COJ67_17980 [Bacillus thuringiensis]|uniref:hypothetical protein n=1 Tax=Bacillus thuringiensis TaxID=1428 RepID=UPI000BF95B71|nr:hypothetical protein [Bacillus thuringiensis]PFN86618.1 hypothetical protein COJ67_17980 [Bacillus thuringiensis]PGY03827.1 hypothetical protein COE41_05700 [Bacillus thuringiensis]
MEKAYLHYIVKWRFKGTDTVMITHHVATCRDGKKKEHSQLIKNTYMKTYDSEFTSLVNIDCKEITEGEYELLKQQHTEVYEWTGNGETI